MTGFGSAALGSVKSHRASGEGQPEVACSLAVPLLLLLLKWRAEKTLCQGMVSDRKNYLVDPPMARSTRFLPNHMPDASSNQLLTFSRARTINQHNPPTTTTFGGEKRAKLLACVHVRVMITRPRARFEKKENKAGRSTDTPLLATPERGGNGLCFFWQLFFFRNFEMFLRSSMHVS